MRVCLASSLSPVSSCLIFFPPCSPLQVRLVNGIQRSPSLETSLGALERGLGREDCLL